MGTKRHKMGLTMFKSIKIEQIKKPDWCFKNLESEQYSKLRNSIFKNGQTRNILVRKLDVDVYEVIDGRNVLDILVEMNAQEVFCFVYEDIDVIDAKLFYLENDYYFECNFVEIAKAMEEILNKHNKISVERHINYNHKEIEDLLKINNFDFEKYKPKKVSVQPNLFE